MTMKKIPDDLLHDTLDEAAPDFSREAALASMIGHLRKKKRYRQRLRIALSVGAAAVLAFLAVVLTHPEHAQEQPVVSVFVKPPAPVAGPARAQAHEITDQQLLALFPKQGAGFIGEGAQRQFYLAARGCATAR
jgi:hypothetical protein